MTLSSSTKSFGKLNVLAMVRKLIDDEVPLLSMEGTPVDGASGSFAQYPVGKGALLIDITNGVFYINEGVTGNPTWTEFAVGGSGDAGGLGQMGSIRGTYDFATQGGVVGDINLLNNLTSQQEIIVPDNAIMIYGLIENITVLTSGGAAEVSVGFNGTGVVQTGVLVASADPWQANGLFLASDITPDTPGTFHKMTADQNLTMTITAFDLTAGKFNVYLKYFQSPD